MSNGIVLVVNCHTNLYYLEARMGSARAGALVLLGKSALTGALGGLLFGFDTAVIAGAIHPLSVHYVLGDWNQGITVSIALWGTVLGALTSGVLGQRIGSRA